MHAPISTDSACSKRATPIEFLDEHKAIGFRIGRRDFTADSDFTRQWRTLLDGLSRVLDDAELKSYVISRDSDDVVLRRLVRRYGTPKEIRRP
jgi:hypothetical protein